MKFSIHSIFVLTTTVALFLTSYLIVIRELRSRAASAEFQNDHELRVRR